MGACACMDAHVCALYMCMRTCVSASAYVFVFVRVARARAVECATMRTVFVERVGASRFVVMPD